MYEHVSATNENLKEAIAKGTFREDLYHRINEFTLRMPDLKERPEDILLFANFFLDQANRELERTLIGFDAAASEALQRYSWRRQLASTKKYCQTCYVAGTRRIYYCTRFRRRDSRTARKSCYIIICFTR